MAHPPLRVGSTLTLPGFFTLAHVARGVSSGEVEKRLGFRAGRLSLGWSLLFMLTKPTPQEFECAGYTHMSGGVPQGHLANPPDPLSAEQRLARDGYDLDRIKAGLIETVFTLQGSKRLAKILPVREAYGVDDYPPGLGVPQWKLKNASPKPFRVAAVIAPGEKYLGDYL